MKVHRRRYRAYHGVGLALCVNWDPFLLVVIFGPWEWELELSRR